MSQYFGGKSATASPVIEDAYETAKKKHVRVTYPSLTAAWVEAPKDDAVYFGRLKQLARVVIGTPGQSVVVMECLSPKIAAGNAGHFGRIANKEIGRKKGKVIAKSKGKQVIATYEPKASRS